MKFTKHKLAFAITTALSSMVVAQDLDPQKDTVQLEGVKIYGQKQIKNLQDTTASVGLMTSDQIEKSTIQDINDVFTRIANLSAVEGGNESIFAIRGVSLYGFTSNPVGYTASVYVDEAPLNIDSIRYGAMGLWDVEQIEVYRGPQGTLQGRNSLMGAIHLKTVDPTKEWSGKAQAVAGPFETSRLSVAGGGALIGDEVSVRLTADTYQSNGYIENSTLNDDDYAGYERANYRAKLKYEPKAFSNVSALLSISRHDSKVGEQPYATTLDPFSNKAGSDVKTKNDTISDTASLKFDINLGSGLDFTSVTSINDVSYDRLDDYDSSSLSFGFIDQHNTGKTVSQELRLAFSNESFDGVTGVFFSKAEENRAWIVDSLFPKAAQFESAETALKAGGATDEQIPFIWAQIPENVDLFDDHDSEYKTTNYAAFADVNWKLNKKVTLTAGLRYDVEEQDRKQVTNRDIRDVVNSGDQTVDFYANSLIAYLEGLGISDNESSTDYEVFLPKLGVTYALTENINTGFTIQQGYRSGGSSVSLLTSQVGEFDPEFTTNYEVSLRSQFLNGEITANANIFYTDWKEQQVEYSPSGDSRDKLIGNAGDSSLYGAEVEVSAYVTSQVEVFTNVGYVKTKFEEFSLNSGGEVKDFKGNEFQDAPNLTATIGSVYRGFDGVFFSVDANYRGEAYTDNENTESRITDARTLLNAKIGYEYLNWSAYVWATNITDENYVINQVDEYVPGGDALSVGAPRMIGASFTTEF